MRPWMLPLLALSLSGCELIEELGGTLDDPTNTTAVYGFATSLDPLTRDVLEQEGIEVVPLPSQGRNGVGSLMYVASLEDGLVQEEPDDEDLVTEGSMELQGCEPISLGESTTPPDNLPYATEDGAKWTVATEGDVVCESTEVRAVYTPPPVDGEESPAVTELPMSIPANYSPELPRFLAMGEPLVMDLSDPEGDAEVTHVIVVLVDAGPPVEDPGPQDYVLWSNEPTDAEGWLAFLGGEQDLTQITLDWDEVERADGSSPDEVELAYLLAIGLSRTDNGELVNANTAFSAVAGGYTVGRLIGGIGSPPEE